MSVEEYHFRSSFYGFNREDVMRYIEAIHRDYAAQLESAKQDLEYERGQRSQVEEKGSIASEEAAAAGKDAQRSKEELAKALEELEKIQREREELRLKLKATQEDLVKLQEAAERMAPAAKAYETLKERAAGIELEAHQRAQDIVKAGEAEAAQTRQKTQEWVRQMESSYGRLRSDVSATISGAGVELERTIRSLQDVATELENHARDLKGIAGKEKPAAAVSESIAEPPKPAPTAKSEPVVKPAPVAKPEPPKAGPVREEKKSPFRR